MSAAIIRRAQAAGPPGNGLAASSLPVRWCGAEGFTLAELVVSIGVLVLLVFLAAQLLNSAASITTSGHKQMDVDAQARQLLDRMAVDFAQMVKRPDVDYYVKSSAASPLRSVLQQGNDQIAFYSAVPGYYLSGSTSTQQSPISLVAYRVYNPSPAPSPCADCNKLQRMGKGLLWNAATASDIPILFMPMPIASPIPVGELPSPTPNPTFAPAWPQAGNMTTDAAYEVIGSQVFRFEYYYLVSGQLAPGAATTLTPPPPILSDIPWDTRICSCPSPTPPATPTPTASPTPTITPPALCCHTAPEGMQDVAAVVVDIAAIDPKSRVLITDCQLAQLNGAPLPPGCPTPSPYPVLIDFSAVVTPYPGQLLAQWQAALDANTYPNGIGLSPPARAGIRVYERYLYLSPPNLQTP